VNAKIIGKVEVAQDHVELIIESVGLSRATPGQFAHILTPGMLRRPISFSRIHPIAEQVGLLFQIVGPGTAWLAQRQEGDDLDILGPLGHGFPPPDPDRPWCLVGGGVGIPPLYSAVERWAGIHGSTPSVVIGARTRQWLLMEDDFNALGLSVSTATDDGSAGQQGTVIKPLAQWLEGHPGGQGFACGPTPMLKAVASLTRGRADTLLALEQRMGCGIGACLACVVPAAGPRGLLYRRVCTEGPVFRAEEMMW
jgi:dihydroorotate dehydrogenase electron transfer subunit